MLFLYLSSIKRGSFCHGLPHLLTIGADRSSAPFSMHFSQKGLRNSRRALYGIHSRRAINGCYMFSIKTKQPIKNAPNTGAFLSAQWIRLTGRGISFRETVTCVPKRIGRWVFANSTRSVLTGNGRKGNLREIPACRSHMRTAIFVSGGLKNHRGNGKLLWMDWNRQRGTAGSKKRFHTTC